jgi:hypothetical protein
LIAVYQSQLSGDKKNPWSAQRQPKMPMNNVNDRIHDQSQTHMQFIAILAKISSGRTMVRRGQSFVGF